MEKKQKKNERGPNHLYQGKKRERETPPQKKIPEKGEGQAPEGGGGEKWVIN